MGQKVHPTGIRLGIVKKHTSTWYAGSDEYADKLYTDLKVREYIQKELASASVSRVEIERPANTARVTIHTARPGVVIGKKGEDVEKLRAAVSKQMVYLYTSTSRSASQIRCRLSSTECCFTAGTSCYVPPCHEARCTERYASRCWVSRFVGGRLGGAEIARSEWYRERVPAHSAC